MLDYIDAPVPYIIGVPLRLWLDIERRRGPQLSDTVICDLHNNRFKCPDAIPDFPPKTEARVYAQLQSIVEGKKRILAECKDSVERDERVD